MPLIATRGASSVQGFGQFAQSGPVNYIEDMFSTYLYTGNGSTQTITNNIDLSTKGGLVWIKERNAAGNYHVLTDTARGTDSQLRSNTAGVPDAEANRLTAFTTSGFSLAGSSFVNGNTNPLVSWTFRKQPKFFDIVTWTGNGANGRTISHNLGSTPGCIMVKCTSAAQAWRVYHRSLTANYNLELNATDGQFSDGSVTSPTSTTFTVNNYGTSNTNTNTYVAYIFAHNAGGFGLTGSDNVISCGSVTGAGNPTEITLGYEPQWLLIKNADSAQDWWLLDNMRGLIVENAASSKRLDANDAEAETGLNVRPTATGFINGVMSVGQNYIYIAIRRGPMKVPTTGTSVFKTIVRAGTGTATAVTGAGFPPDFMISHSTNVGSNNVAANDKLRGPLQFIATNTTSAESNVANALVSLDQDGFSVGTLAGGPYNVSGQTNAAWMFRRAPSFFDEVCYTGTGSATTFSHNLQAVPELMIVKERNGANGWQVYSAALTNTDYLILNTTAGTASSATRWNSTTPTSTVFSVGTHGATNGSGQNFVNYLFATCAGVSKVGSYTGTGTTKQIDCGFTAGARFVLIKRTDSTGDWYVWDTARGIVAGNDSYLLLNSAAAEVTSTDYIDTYSAGFEISSTAPAAINASAGTYIFLAIA
jgi:hypothetical protein